MVKENIKINFFPIEIVGLKVKIYVSNKKTTELLNKFRPFLLLKLTEAKIIGEGQEYWSFAPFPESKEIEIDPNKDLDIAKKYVSKLLYEYFLDMDNVYVRRDFIGAVTVYEKGAVSTHNGKQLRSLQGYTIRCEYWDSSKRLGIVVAKERDTYCTVQPYSLFSSTVQLERVNRIIFNNMVGKYSDFEGKDGFDNNSFYLMRSRMLSDIFPLYKIGYTKENKYVPFHKGIVGFVKKYLFEKEFGSFVKFPYSKLMSVPDEDIFATSRESNLLSFKHDQTTFNVYNGLKEYGPLYVPDRVNNIKFFFIFHQDDGKYANQFLSYIIKGYRGFPGFSQFVGIPVTNESVDKSKTIKYTQANPAQEVIQQVNQINFSDGEYVAFYLSRIHKEEQDCEKRDAYYKIKEALLQKGIVSQVIDRDKLSSQYYNFYLPNIGIALLAKLAGIPWKLAKPASADLVVGIGARKKADNVFFGNTICFKNDGTFEEFDAFSENDVSPLGNAFKDKIRTYVDKNPDAQRLVIHFFKKMNNKEERCLLDILGELNISIPYVVLTITDNPSKDYVIFDEGFEGLMPVSGTYVRIRKRMYILANNERYENTMTLKIGDYPFPIKIYFSKCRDVDLNDKAVVNGLIYQVYQFSRIHWRSIRQKSKPVTIRYSEIIAEMTSCFEHGTLPENIVSHKALWFL